MMVQLDSQLLVMVLSIEGPTRLEQGHNASTVCVDGDASMLRSKLFQRKPGTRRLVEAWLGEIAQQFERSRPEAAIVPAWERARRRGQRRG
jgi:hypothetical protein